MEDLIRQGLYVTASVLRLEQHAQNASIETRKELDIEPFVHSECIVAPELARDHVKIIEGLVCDLNEAIDCAQKRASLLEKISSLACHSCLVKKAKIKAKSKRKLQAATEHSPEMASSPTTDTIEPLDIVVDAAAAELRPISKAITSSPKKAARKAFTPKSSSISSGPVLSNFFSIVRKENESGYQGGSSEHPMLLESQTHSSSSGFWSYFPTFFVKPNVKMAKFESLLQKTRNTGATIETTNENNNRRSSKEIEQLSLLPMVRFKLFHFAENIRPCYFGTFSKQSLIISGRRPFAKDLSKELELDYSVESDNEWEDDCDELEGEIENISDTDQSDSGSEDDEGEGEEEEEDSSWLVPHGYLSDDELMCDERDERDVFSLDQDMNDPVSRKRLQDSWRADGQSNPTLNGVPRIYSSLGQTSEQDSLYLSSFSMRPFMNLFAIDSKICPQKDGLIIDNLTSTFRMIERHDVILDLSLMFKKKKKRAITPLISGTGAMQEHNVPHRREIPTLHAMPTVEDASAEKSYPVEKENLQPANVQPNTHSERAPIKRIAPIMISGK